ncbi:MAG: hypothetical protein J6O04_09530 [Selenomonadaceae bacterium]|nr:hypothetical protein [Selenomonadaceae bacterium]
MTVNKIKAKRKAKDTVFTDLFRIPRYHTELVNILAPEINAKPKDVELTTLNYVLTDRCYNDFGALAKNKLIFCSESQSTWSLNIVFRLFLYAAITYQEYVDKHRNIDLYSTTTQKLPMLNCSVIYCGKDKNLPEYISLNKEFWHNKSPLDLKVRVLHKAGTGNVVKEYIRFCHVYDEQVKLYGYSQTAIEKTIYICSKENVLKDYLEERAKEVHDIMFTLFDPDEVMERHIEYEKRIAREEGISDMIKNMLSLNIPLEQIVKASGWSKDKILSLQ